MAQPYLQVLWNPFLILLSYMISWLGAFVAVSLCEQFRQTRVNWKSAPTSTIGPNLILHFMSIAIGGVAIWSMVRD